MIICKKTDNIKNDNHKMTSESKWYNEWHQMIKSSTTVVNFPTFWIGEKPSDKHPKENSIKLEENLQEI